jgi:hypothetical protein
MTGGESITLIRHPELVSGTFMLSERYADVRNAGYLSCGVLK